MTKCSRCPCQLLYAIIILLLALQFFETGLHFPSRQERMIHDYYNAETAVMVSPHGIRKKMAKGDTSFLLVDLRSQQEYEQEHIIGAVNVPAYSDPNHSAYGEIDRMVGSFRDLEERYPNRQLIAYCYSIPCMTGRKIGKILADHGIYVKSLGVGWNEWRYFWTMWNHQHEWQDTNVEDYVISGPEPGTPKIDPDYISPCIEGAFDC